MSAKGPKAARRKTLPPLEAGKVYRVADFEYLSFAARSLWRQETGEDAAILRLLLKNSTTLEIPLSDEALKDHLRLLCEAFPSEAIAYVRERWPDEASQDGANPPQP